MNDAGQDNAGRGLVIRGEERESERFKIKFKVRTFEKRKRQRWRVEAQGAALFVYGPITPSSQGTAGGEEEHSKIEEQQRGQKLRNWTG